MPEVIADSAHQRVPAERRKLDRNIFIATSTIMLLHLTIKGAMQASGIPLNPVVNYLLNDTADLPLAYVNGWMTDRIFEPTPMLRRSRQIVSGAISAASILAGEIPLVNDFFSQFLPSALAKLTFGTPRLIEIPAGLVGTGLYLGVNMWLNRRRNIRQQPQY